MLEKIRAILSPFILRRLKKDVIGELVGKIERVEYCPPTSYQKHLYDQLTQKGRQMFRDGVVVEGGGDSPSNMLMEMRKVDLFFLFVAFF